MFQKQEPSTGLKMHEKQPEMNRLSISLKHMWNKLRKFETPCKKLKIRIRYVRLGLQKPGMNLMLRL